MTTPQKPWQCGKDCVQSRAHEGSCDPTTPPATAPELPAEWTQAHWDKEEARKERTTTASSPAPVQSAEQFKKYEVKMIIYVVEGSTGEYSDHFEWLVCAFKDEVKARTRVVEAQARANEIFAKTGRYGDVTEVNEFDSNYSQGYTGTHYTYYPVELLD